MADKINRPPTEARGPKHFQHNRLYFQGCGQARENLGRELGFLLFYLQGANLEPQERLQGWRMFRASLKRYVAL